MKTLLRSARYSIVSVLFLIFFALPSGAQEPPRCRGDLQVRLSSQQTTQGSVVLATIHSVEALESLSAEWDGKKIALWEVTTAAGSRRSSRMPTWDGLLGVDLEQRAGTYALTVRAKNAAGRESACSVALVVKEGKFATENLTVEKQFVDPDPQQLERVTSEQRKLRELFALETPERFWRGPFRLPLTGVSKGTNFGRRRVLNGEPRPPHTGVDFPAPTGTSVHATQRGRVVFAGDLFFSGNTVVIDHGLGIYTLYGHLSKITAQGQLVNAGFIVGKVGATGRVTGPHLHWGLTIARAKVDPLQIVRLLKNP